MPQNSVTGSIDTNMSAVLYAENWQLKTWLFTQKSLMISSSPPSNPNWQCVSKVQGSQGEKKNSTPQTNRMATMMRTAHGMLYYYFLFLSTPCKCTGAGVFVCVCVYVWRLHLFLNFRTTFCSFSNANRTGCKRKGCGKTTKRKTEQFFQTK